MTLLRTPETVSRAVLALCERIGSNSKPIYLAIEPEADCEPLDCFANVQRKVQREGGSLQAGWAIWIWPNVYIEAEHHAVYAMADGSRWKDITPQQEAGFTRRLFLPDNTAEFDFESDGWRRDNVRLAIANDPLVRQFFRTAERRNEILNSIPGFGVVELKGALAAEYEQSTQTMMQLQLALALKYTRPNDQCFCQSGRKFKKCHGRRF